MRHAALFLAVVGLAGCAADNGVPVDYTRSWSAIPVDSVTVDVSLAAAVPDAEELLVLPLDVVLGFHVGSAAYNTLTVDDGFVVIRRDAGRLLRFDSLGHLVADVPMTGVADPFSAAVCAQGDSALVVDGSTLINQPRNLVWLSLRGGGDTLPAAPRTVSLPLGSMEVRCRSMGGRWVLSSEIQDQPGDFTGRITTTLLDVSPDHGVSETPLLSLADHSVRLRDTSGNARMQSSPWSPPLLVAGDALGRLYVVDGPSGVVRIIDTTAAGAKLRGITPRPERLTRGMIDSVAVAWRELDVSRVSDSVSNRPENRAILVEIEREIRGVEPGATIPEVDRLLVGADGSFALLASDWLVQGAKRWDLFGPDGDYLGAVKFANASRAVGVQQGTIWYVRTAGDSADGAPELVRARPVAAPVAGH